MSARKMRLNHSGRNDLTGFKTNRLFENEEPVFINSPNAPFAPTGHQTLWGNLKNVASQTAFELGCVK